MMPIEDWEISGYLDGELPAERRQQVARAIAEDDRLRQEYERLVALDARLQTIAQAAAFEPRILLPVKAMANRLPVFQLACALCIVRVVLKLLPTTWSVGLGTVLLAALLAFGIQYLLRLSEEDRRQIVGTAAAHSPTML